MKMYPRIITALKKMVDNDKILEEELSTCISLASWTPPGWNEPIADTEGFYQYLLQLMNTTPVENSFSNLFHGVFYIISRNDNRLQNAELPEFAPFREWLVLFSEFYGSFMNTSKSANNLFSFTNDITFQIDDFQIPPGGYNSFNTFFSRFIRPGKRPIGTRTMPCPPPAEGKPIPQNPRNADMNEIHNNMCDDRVIVVPADSVYKGHWPIQSDNTITTSKGNRYKIADLLRGSRYADRFKNGMFTHSYLTVFTYHRYHVPVRGVIKETMVTSGQVFADVSMHEDGSLYAHDGTGYQFKQDRGLVVLESPVGLVALVPIGMDFISSCNLTVDVDDYVNKGDEFGYFLFGGSDLIMLFERNDIVPALEAPDKDREYFYKLGQVFARVEHL